MKENSGIKIIATNRKARFSYHIIDTWEAGLVLQGTEVKSLRDGKAGIVDSHARIIRNEIYLFHLHISPYTKGNVYNHEPTRPRKLLLHRREIRKIEAKVQEKGMTLIPLKIYFKNGRAKVEIGLAKGKRLYDKRKDITARDMKRDSDREMARRF